MSAEVKRKFTVDEESHVVDLCCDSAPSVKDKATKSKENGVVAAKDDLFASLVKSQSSQKWECDACMTRNDTDKVKCACCETPRPSAKASSEVKQPANINSFMPTAKPTDDLFKSIVAKQKTENWECGECLTRNMRLRANACAVNQRNLAQLRQQHRNRASIRSRVHQRCLRTKDSRVSYRNRTHQSGNAQRA